MVRMLALDLSILRGDCRPRPSKVVALQLVGLENCPLKGSAPTLQTSCYLVLGLHTAVPESWMDLLQLHMTSLVALHSQHSWPYSLWGVHQIPQDCLGMWTQHNFELHGVPPQQRV